MTPLQEFGEWLRQQRRARGWTQQELAERAHVSPNYVSTIERAAPHSQSGGEIRPSEDVVEALAYALGVTSTEARLRAGYAPPDADPVNDEERLLSWFRGMQPQLRPAALSVLRSLFEQSDRSRA